MTTNSYWQLTESERAALTEQDVEQYVDFELMQCGVLRVKPLVLQDEPKLPEPECIVYRIVVGGNRDLAFATQEQAKAFLELSPLGIDHGYIDGQFFYHLDASREAKLEVDRLMSNEQFLAARKDLEKLASIRRANEKAKTEYGDALKAQKTALSGLWADWQECREKGRRLGRIVETFRDYLKIAGDEAVAGKFLLKVFPRQDIEDAMVWCQVVIPLPPEGEIEFVAPKAQPPSQEITF